jgi:hypothetical protein
MPARTLSRRHVSQALSGGPASGIVVIGLVAAAPALARSGSVGPASRTAWAPGLYADAVPIDGGRLATMKQDGTLAFIADPVAGP